MSEYTKTAKELHLRLHVWRYALDLLPKDPTGHIYRLFSIVRLDGWTSDPQEIIEAFANDPAFSIQYADTKVTDMKLTSPNTKKKVNNKSPNRGEDGSV